MAALSLPSGEAELGGRALANQLCFGCFAFGLFLTAKLHLIAFNSSELEEARTSRF